MDGRGKQHMELEVRSVLRCPGVHSKYYFLTQDSYSQGSGDPSSNAFLTPPSRKSILVLFELYRMILSKMEGLLLTSSVGGVKLFKLQLLLATG